MFNWIIENPNLAAWALFAPLYLGMEWLAWRRIFANAGDTTLLIIDMQDKWDCSRPIVSAVLKEIELARKYGWSIVVVEFHGHNKSFPTHQVILDAVAAARVPKITVIKFQENGGDVILEACQKHGLGTRNFRVAGVKLLHCLGLSIGTMARKLVDSYFYLVREATNGDDDLDHRDYYHDPNSCFVDQDDVEAQLEFAHGSDTRSNGRKRFKKAA